MNSFDIPRIQSLLKPRSQSYAGDERITLNVPERQAGSIKSTQQDNLDEVIIGQLSPSEKVALMEAIKEYADVFAANPKAVVTCRGPPTRVDLQDPDSAPYVAPYATVFLSSERGFKPRLRSYTQIWNNCTFDEQVRFKLPHSVRKKDRTTTVVQGFRGLTHLSRPKAGDLGTSLPSTMKWINRRTSLAWISFREFHN